MYLAWGISDRKQPNGLLKPFRLLVLEKTIKEKEDYYAVGWTVSRYGIRKMTFDRVINYWVK